jgi:glycosyltransferase involved in cell wall biosynthesis
MHPKLSIVIATLNRQASLLRLLEQISIQTLPAHDFETIVVDDGSRESVASVLHLRTFPYPLTILRSERTGASAARNRGIECSSGEIIVILDDDVQIAPDFLVRHLDMHPPGSRNVVLGWIRPDPAAGLSLFERFHADVLERFARDARSGKLKLQGTHMATGNVSFRRADYVSVGGFDSSLEHSEDAELGVRLQKAGATLTFSDLARVIHSSDHSSLAAWMRRAFVYGVCDLRISRKHPEALYANPWRYLWLVHPLSRVLLFASILVPGLMKWVAQLAMQIAHLLDHLHARRAAIAATTVVYGIQYFRGVRHHEGSVNNAIADYRRYRRAKGTESTAAASSQPQNRPALTL